MTTIQNYLVAAGFLGTILAANYVTTEYGLIPVGFGLVAIAGTYFAGLAFVLRDELQRRAGKLPTVAVIAAGALLSFLVSAPFIATASAAAFAVSELADMAVYTPLRKRGYLKAVGVSNVVGTLVDTLIFLSIAGFPVMAALPGQLIGKLTITVAFVGLVLAWRTRRRLVAA